MRIGRVLYFDLLALAPALAIALTLSRVRLLVLELARIPAVLARRSDR